MLVSVIKQFTVGFFLFLFILVSHDLSDLAYGQTEDNTSNFQNMDKNIEFEYPSDWNMEILDDDLDSHNILVWSPNQNSLLMFSYEYPIIKNAVKEIVENQRDLDSHVFKNYNFIELKQTSFLDYDAWKYAYSFTDDFGDEIKTEELFFEENNLLYVIGFSSSVEMFDAENSIANSIKDSLKIHPIDVKKIIFEDKENKFQITYPKNWVAIEEGLLDTCVVQLFSQLEGLDDKFQENITFCVHEIPKDVTLEEYGKSLSSEMKKMYIGFEIIESEKITLGNSEGYKYVTLGSASNNLISSDGSLQYDPVTNLTSEILDEKTTLKQLMAYTIKDGKSYNVSFGTEPDQFSNYLPVIEKIIDSMEFTDEQKSLSKDIPQWIKNNAEWWVDGQIDNDTFLQGIEFLVKEKIIQVRPDLQVGEVSKDIPQWIKNNAEWWIDGQIDNDTFLQGIEFLINQGIISQ